MIRRAWCRGAGAVILNGWTSEVIQSSRARGRPIGRRIATSSTFVNRGRLLIRSPLRKRLHPSVDRVPPAVPMPA